MNIMDISIQQYVNMDNNNYTTNAFFDNSGFNSANSLTHFLDAEPN